MLFYVLIYVASYFGLYKTFPLLRDPIYDNDIYAQILRHLMLIYASYHLANFLWRQKFVSSFRVIYFIH